MREPSTCARVCVCELVCVQVIHGTDTLAYTASALSLMLQGFNKPIIMTGSQLPLAAPRTDARQNLLGTHFRSTCSLQENWHTVDSCIRHAYPFCMDRLCFAVPAGTHSMRSRGL